MYLERWMVGMVTDIDRGPEPIGIRIADAMPSIYSAAYSPVLLDSDRCEMCASEMKVAHCKKQCMKCGFMVSCVD